MSRLAKGNPSLRVQKRLRGIHFQRKCASCENKVKLGHVLHVILEILDMPCRLIAQICQNNLDFLLLFDLKFTNIIVELDNSHRLYEERRAGG